jgi:hypothetical protein
MWSAKVTVRSLVTKPKRDSESLFEEFHIIIKKTSLMEVFS